MASEAVYSERDMTRVRQAYEQAMNERQEDAGQESTFNGSNNDNLVQWQLELDNILERIDHLLRGHKLELVNGNVIWSKPKDLKEAMFNDYGANEILRILSMYLNRNTILSNYDEDQVEAKVYDFGIEVSDLILNKYEDMGLDTYEKMVRYPMIIRELIDTIHSSFLRALNGGERESLREARTVNQSIPMTPVFNQQKQERGLLNPFRYINGKYK